MTDPPTRRPLTPLAWWNVLVHAVALLCAALWLRPGGPGAPLDERLAYLSGSATAWSLGWGAWLVCSLSLVAFYAALAWRLPEHADMARLAVVLGCAGLAVDLVGYSVQIAVLPMLAGMGSEAVPAFLAMERFAGAAGLIGANGLYVVAGLLLTLCLRGRAPLAVPAGYVTAFFGGLLVVAGFTGSAWQAMAATPPTMIAYCLWAVLAARALEKA
jgi:hypothetical protein